MEQPSKPLKHDDYTVACICPMGVELAAVKGILDDLHPGLPSRRDAAGYTLGRIGEHNIVIAVMPGTGLNRAAQVALQLLNDFASIRFGLLVGIGGGVPSKAHDIRLGDVVVSKPTDTFGGVVQYDLGKRTIGGQFQRTGSLKKPPAMLLAAVQQLEAKHRMEESEVPVHIEKMLEKYPKMKRGGYTFPGVEEDTLYDPTYDHEAGDTCSGCDQSRLVNRSPRYDSTPEIFYGTIGSGNAVIKDGTTRERLRHDLGILCVEMEAAGLMDEFQCLVIRGICDYADSHKNKRWQPYAAATAAAYMKEFLLIIPAAHVKETSKAADVIDSQRHHVDFSLKGIPAIDRFIGRQADIKRIEDFFQPGKGSQSRRKVFVLCGMGGIGKTQLAVEFLRTHQNDYTAIFWLDGSSEEQLKQSLVNAALRIPQKELNADTLTALRDSTTKREMVVRGVLQWLSIPTNTKWMLVLDNVDNDYLSEHKDPNSFNIEAYFPAVDTGSILITSRLKVVRRQLGNGLEVGQTNSDDSKRILESNAGELIQDADDIVQNLHGLPLALAQAGAYIGLNGITAAQYLKLYSNTWTALMKSHKFSLPEYKNRTILTTWKLSYDQVKAKSDEAAGLLKLWGMLDPSSLWFELIEAANRVHEDIEVPSWLQSLAEQQLSYIEALGLLTQYCLVRKTEGSEGYSMHPVLHQWCSTLVEGRETECLGWVAASLIAEIVPADNHPDAWKIQRRIYPHGNEIYRWIQGIGGAVGEAKAGIYLSMGLLFSYYAALPKTEEMYQRALDGYEKALRPDHTSTLDTVHNLGILYSNQGKLKEAEEMYKRALNGKEKALGPDHTSTLDTVNNLGILYSNQGKLKEAEEMYKRALDGYEKALGPDHTSTLNTVNNLGNLYSDQGKLKEAEEMYQRALDGCEKALGPDHTSTLDTVHNLGILYSNQGKLKEAEEMYQRALNGKEKALGPDHTSTLDTVHNLGSLYSDQGKLKEAEEMYQRALDGYEKVLGPDHTSTLHVRKHWEDLHIEQTQSQGKKKYRISRFFHRSRS